MKFRFHVFPNFFAYGVLYCTVQLCRAAISMLVFFSSVSQCKTDCKYNFRVFSAVFIRFTILSVGRKQVTLLQLLKQVTLLFFESLRSEQDSYAPIFSMYVTVAQRTREDVKYFRGELYISSVIIWNTIYCHGDQT